MDSNYRGPAAQLSYRDPLEAEYRQLIELRKRVRQAEAAASKRFTIATRKKEFAATKMNPLAGVCSMRAAEFVACSARVVTTKVRSSRLVEMPWWRAWGRSVQSVGLRPL